MEASFSSSGRQKQLVRNCTNKIALTCSVSVHGVISSGSLIATLGSWLFLGLLLYFVIGYLFNLLIKGKSGGEAIPNYWFWSELGGFFRELFSNLKTRLTGSSGGYTQI